MSSFNLYADLYQNDELRLVQPQHALALFALIDAHRAALRTWLPWIDTVRSTDDARRLIASQLERLAGGGGPTAGIWSGGELVGVIGFNGVDQRLKRADIGYWIVPPAEGRGLVTRALRVFVAFAFDELGLDKLELNIASENTRSAAVAQRVGFIHEGRRRHAERLPDRVVDHDLYGLLRGEFEASMR